ncbi:MAG: multidrug efflux pump subunit AcrB [Polaribacter sp.]|jgi:multidrug efflux pump subunit AcrB
MRSIIKFFLVNSVAANLLMVFIFIMGGVGLLNMKTTFFPETPNKIINIQMIFPGASPEEMEEGVTSKVEENLIGVKGIDKTTSVSSENSANIVVEAKEGVNMDELLQDVKNAVDRISSFPTAMEPPVIFKAEQVSDAYKFAISGNIDLKILKKFAQDIEDDLLAIDGISKTELIGFPEEEIEISFREKDMRALDIAFNEAVTAIAQTNLLATGGTIETESEDLLIRAKNKNYYAAEFRDIVIRSNPNGGVVRLAQIADVKDRWEDTPIRNFVNGVPGVSINVFNTVEEDMFSVSEKAQTYLADFRLKHPEVTVTEIRDGKLYLNGRIEFIKENGAIGFLIVFILLAMFLNIRLAFWVAVAIPISFAGMFMSASLLGITVNVISTFGMVVVIGILVDDGIVIAENIYQHYERGAKPMDAALEGTMEVLPAVTAAIVTTVIAFSLFFFIEGRLGDIFSQLAVVVIFTLIFSLIEGAFILPAHIAHSKALTEGNVNPITRYFDRVMNFLRKRMYGPVLNFSMRFPLPTITICVTGLLIVMGAFAGGFIKGTFFPFVQSDNFSVSLELPAGANEARVHAILDSIETVSWEVNESFKDKYFGGEKNVIEKIVKTVGPASYKGTLTYYLLSGEERPEVKNRMLTNSIREKLGPVEEAEKLIFGLGGIFGDPVSISLIGKNKTEINDAVTDLKEELSKITDLRDIQDNNAEGLKEVAIELKPKAYNLGLTLGQIMQYVRQGFFGVEIQRLQRGSDEVKVWIRYGEDDRSSLDDLANMRYRSPNGQSIPLGELVSFSTERGVVNINHLNGQREIRVTADVSDEQVSVSDVNNDINTEILPRVLARYPSVKVSFEGQAKENKKGQDSMGRVAPLIALCMLFVIILTFGSVSQAFVVFALFPFGFIGVGLGHWFLGLPISFLSVLGMIALIGILVNDALVFISTFNGKIKEGYAFKPALYDTGVSRFRPILLTTVTTVAGLLPLLLEDSVQAQFLIPMAVSIAFGLMVSTFILLVLIPALLVIASDIRLFSTKLWTGNRELTRAMVEPSYPERNHPWVLTFFFALLALGGIAALVKITLVIAESAL